MPLPTRSWSLWTLVCGMWGPLHWPLFWDLRWWHPRGWSGVRCHPEWLWVRHQVPPCNPSRESQRRTHNQVSDWLINLSISWTDWMTNSALVADLSLRGIYNSFHTFIHWIYNSSILTFIHRIYNSFVLTFNHRIYNSFALTCIHWIYNSFAVYSQNLESICSYIYLLNL